MWQGAAGVGNPLHQLLGQENDSELGRGLVMSWQRINVYFEAPVLGVPIIRAFLPISEVSE